MARSAGLDVLLRIGICAAIALLSWLVWPPAGADDHDGQAAEPLHVKIGQVWGSVECTAGAMTDVWWEIAGGEAPYRVAVNGQQMSTTDVRVEIPCGSRLHDQPSWIAETERFMRIAVEVSDARGTVARATLDLALRPALDPPTKTRISAGFGGRLSGGFAAVDANGSRRGAHLLLARWREVGGAPWRYQLIAHLTVRDGAYVSFDLETGTRATPHEVQFARLRTDAERSEPERLRWSKLQTVTTFATPSNLVAKVTHDTVALSWEPDAPGLYWDARLTRDGQVNARSATLQQSQYLQHEIGPQPPYRTVFRQLSPDTDYTVAVGPTNWPIEGWLNVAIAFDVRTEPAPPGWAEALLPVDSVRTIRWADGSIGVEWGSPSNGVERGYELDVYEYGAPRQRWNRYEIPGGTREFSTEPMRRGTVYQVALRAKGIDEPEARRLFRTLPEFAIEPTGARPPPAWRAEVTEQSGSGWQEGGYGFSARWMNDPEIELVQVEWLVRGQRLTRSGSAPPLVLVLDESDPVHMRLRARTGGVWSRWSPPVRVAMPPPRPDAVKVQERLGGALVSWSAPTDIAGLTRYRLEIRRNGVTERELDAGLATSVLVPLDPDGAAYEFRVMARHPIRGESASEPIEFVQGEVPTFAKFARSGDHRACDPLLGVQGQIAWRIVGGTAPFTVSLEGLPAVTSMVPSGYVLMDCEPVSEAAEPDRDSVFQWVPATVTDARGRTDSRPRPLEILVRSQESADDLLAEREAWRLATVKHASHSDSIRLLIEGPDSSYLIRQLLVRWRPVGGPTWTTSEAAVSYSRSRVELSGLKPASRIEYQFAPRVSEIDVSELSEGDWSPVHKAETAPVAIDAFVHRRGEDLWVSWDPVPGVYSYQVVLRADDVSWWKRHFTTSPSREHVRFSDIPEDVAVEVEVTAPASVYGAPILPPGFVLRKP